MVALGPLQHTCRRQAQKGMRLAESIYCMIIYMGMDAHTQGPQQLVSGDKKVTMVKREVKVDVYAKSQIGEHQSVESSLRYESSSICLPRKRSVNSYSHYCDCSLGLRDESVPDNHSLYQAIKRITS